ncbi:MAG: GtrA family protein [Erysipelotrichaceae bacterium]|nr:GtrA family protein [Erysipelotrichaceae bacterium]
MDGNTYMKGFLTKNRSVILYIIFGVLTTLVNIVSYWLLTRWLKQSVNTATVVAWILSVLFAYITNRTWVFDSKAIQPNEVIREIVSFFLARLSTGLLDWLIMFVFVTKLSLPDMPVKIASNILVIVLNYVLSRFLVFKKR